ncbi:MAG: hypothetical protein LBM38_03270 [Clostridiales bacterium]|jgi:hypothetical protein|nr:hypothetical protein [Clostridiales bacterium]
MEYDEIIFALKDVFQIDIENELLKHKESDLIACSYLTSLYWGTLSLSFDHDSTTTFLFQTITQNIANTVLAITKLSLCGLSFQAEILIRNLLENCFLLLNVMLDHHKRERFIDSAKKKNTYSVWKKYFTFKNMYEAIENYMSNLKDEANDENLSENLKKMYHEYSSAVHNDYFTQVMLLRSKPKNPDDIMKLNLWGEYTDYLPELLHSLCFINHFTKMLFNYILADNNIEFTFDDLIENRAESEIWKDAVFLHLFLTEYYLLAWNY